MSKYGTFKSVGTVLLDLLFYITLACVGGVINHMRGEGVGRRAH